MTPVSSLSDLRGGQVWKQQAFPYCSCYIVYLGGDHFIRTSMPDQAGSIAMTADGDGPIYPAVELLALLVEKGYECAGQFVDSLQAEPDGERHHGIVRPISPDLCERTAFYHRPARAGETEATLIVHGKLTEKA